MNKKLFLSLPLVLLLTGCNIAKASSDKQEQSSSNNSSGDSSSVISSDSSSSGSESSSSYSSQGGGSGNTKTFDFTKVFTGTGSVRLADKKTEFLEYLNTGGSYVSSVNVDDCVFFQPIYHSNGDQNGLSLCVGTASAGGSISFTFTESIKSITFIMQAYNKYYSSAFHADDNSTLTVEGHNYVLDTSLSSGMPPMQEETIQISPSKQTITFSNSSDHQRSFVHSLTIEY